MPLMTYQTLIRAYSDNVSKSLADTDLTPRQRSLTATMLNLASNAGYAQCYYPPTDRTRDDVVKHLSDVMWDARWLALAVSKSADADITVAHERAIEILRNI